MASPWGALPQGQQVAQNVEGYIEAMSSDEKTLNREPTPGESTMDSSEDGEKVHELARALTQASIKHPSGDHVNPFNGADNSLLDPLSDEFSYKVWTKNLLGIQSRDPERYPSRVAGVSYKNLSAHGFGEATDYQKTFGNYPLELPGLFTRLIGKSQKTKIQILRNFDGLVKSGEMLVVLGRPGSGCSTLLKTISGEVDGFFIDKETTINYQGIPMKTMHKDFRGECIYQAEVDVHFPQLTVGQTLEFAAQARAPRNRIPGVTRDQYAAHMRDVIMAVFGLTHTINTQVGNDFIRGVSGGERKRVSIAEAALGGSPLQCWDNSTRGLDSATALEFVRTLRLSTEMSGSAAVVAIYQASQSIYDVFDKVAVLYEGRQIYFGEINAAKEFFINMGFDCPLRQTTADFLTSLTSPAERIVRKGFEGKTPFTPDEFAAMWHKSADRAKLLQEIEEFEKEFPIGGEYLETFKDARRAAQAKGQRIKSPYTLSVVQQVKLCTKRSFQRLRGDATLFFSGLFGQAALALIISSVFYNLQNQTSTLYSRGALLFFAILMAAFQSFLEILTLYAQRGIVEKQAKYAFYHPFSEAIASMIADLPNKIGVTIIFDVVVYFMTNLRRTPEHFFIFFLFTFVCTLTMSMYFRSIGALSRTLAQAMAPAAIFILALVIYTGFAIPTKDMHPWFRWINYLDPVAYAFEALMVNEFHDRNITCSQFVPAGGAYDAAPPSERICATTGAAAGANYVDGDVYLMVNYKYSYSHLWRNLGIMFALMVVGCAIYLTATEYISAKKSKGEVLLFTRGNVPDIGSTKADEETQVDERVNTEMVLARTKTVPDAPASIQKQTAIFHWDDVNYDIKIKNEPRRLLDQVDGWVKPGTLTALMGVSGAGKTTLLDVLASRTTMGIVTGEMLVDGHQRNTGFQRKTGYVQQQDLHLATTTVREALAFSAILRQPKKTPYNEKVAYVDEVIKVLEMEAYADAVVGVPGEGLNVEQRKRLTIGVELAAKPALLLFLDEPTSGLDSQTAWSICALLRKLADNGQAILCTIHQPSAILFQEFDRLLFLAKGGKTVYFGDIGDHSRVLTEYFERNGSRKFGIDENPAEVMLEVIGAAPGSETKIDWPTVWNSSPERTEIKKQLTEMKATLLQKELIEDENSLDPYAASFGLQMWTVLRRVFSQYWRTPSYLYSKTVLCVCTGLFIGFSFWKSPTSLQGMQNQLFAIFMLLTVFGNLVQQIMPHFVVQRALYEVRERPSKTYSWQVFILSNVFVEIPWNGLMGVLMFFTWYYPIGLQQNASYTDSVAERGGLMFLFIFSFLLFTSTFTSMVIAGIESAEAGGNIAQLLFSLTLIFNGVLASPSQFPGFWIFMYRVSPFTYLVGGVLSTGLANAPVHCADVEFLHFDPPANTTCLAYLQPYMDAAGGYVQEATRESFSNCAFCPLSDTNSFLASVNIYYSERWRNFGIMWVYIVFNTFGAIFLYWLARVPKNTMKEQKEKKE
ncbi:putative ABC transporter CDR4 [Amylocarpus encephaloides]|uniref:ABC transporter CDR4 n=1 Tax=Amylocarpus encephaloides TaxID=45428 RepID=A0A9P7YDP2_9HELO|nr:putative ABC transporter CDR4 [Amylocarpus encephaloides]